MDVPRFSNKIIQAFPHSRIPLSLSTFETTPRRVSTKPALPYIFPESSKVIGGDYSLRVDVVHVSQCLAEISLTATSPCTSKRDGYIWCQNQGNTCQIVWRVGWKTRRVSVELGNEGVVFDHWGGHVTGSKLRLWFLLPQANEIENDTTEEEVRVSGTVLFRKSWGWTAKREAWVGV